MKATGGFNFNDLGTSSPVWQLANPVMRTTRYSDAAAVWKERRSPDFDLSFSGVETYGLTLGDMEDLKALGSK